MTLTFKPDYFHNLRNEEKSKQNETLLARAEAFLSDIIDDSKDSEDIVIDYDKLLMHLAESRLFDDDRMQKTNITDLVSKIERLQPNTRQIRPGVYVVIGRAGKGKTKWIRDLLSRDSFESHSILLNHDEPSLASDEFGTSRGLPELLHCFDEIAKMPEINIVALDGVRTIQYEATGNTLSGGVNSGFFRFLTDAGNAAVASGVVCLFTYNPNTERDELYQVVAAMVDGSVQGVIDLDRSVIRSRYAKRMDKPLSEAAEVLFGAASTDEDDSSTNDNYDHSEV